MENERSLPTVLRKKLPPNLEKIKYGTYTRADKDYSINLYLRDYDLRCDQENSDIVKWLKGKNILITGATGFLGKLLVEKLLRCCQDIGTIYLVVRAKKGNDTKERVNEYLDNWVFRKLSDIYPDYRDKVVGLSGDFEQDAIGLSEESREIIADNVNIIYHVAATIRFDEKLAKAVKINIRGTQEMINIAKKCKKLDVFVHVSTAYSNCHEKVISEQFYEPLLDPYKLIALTESLPKEVLERITPSLLGGLPNTYAYTKQIAESIVRKEAIGMPAMVIRPSIVIASAKEPIRSWIDNIFGPAGMVEGASLGVVHTMRGNPNGIADMVPVDYVINSTIAASYKTAKERQLDQIPIYNYVSSSDNPIRWRYLGLAGEHGRKVGSVEIKLKGFFRFCACYYWWAILSFLLHTVPGFIVDSVVRLMGQKPRLGAIYTKMNKFEEVLTHFTMNEWLFLNDNTRTLWESLNVADKKNFPFDLRPLDWQDYFDTYLVAMREFLIRDFLDTLDAGRRHLLIVDIVHYIVTGIVVGSSVYFLSNTIFFFIPLTFVAITLYYLFTSEK